jgi:hypothetical protein
MLCPIQGVFFQSLVQRPKGRRALLQRLKTRPDAVVRKVYQSGFFLISHRHLLGPKHAMASFSSP